MLITVKTLEKITGKAANQNMQAVIDGLKMAGKDVGLDKPHRLAMYLAQLAHETNNFIYDKEIWGPTKAQKRYDTRTDLGNTPQRDGDGFIFRGRGAIQITGKANYRDFTKWSQSIDPSAPDFTQDPDAVLTDIWEGLVPIWYWSTRNINALADKGDYTAVTRKINGGTNGLTERRAKYVRAALVLLGYAPTDIKTFQRVAKIKADGIAGPITRAKLHERLKTIKVKFNEDITMDKKFQLVDGAGQFYKHWSFWGIALLGILPFLEQNIDAISAVIPAPYQVGVHALLAGIVASLRFVKQHSIKK